MTARLCHEGLPENSLTEDLKRLIQSDDALLLARLGLCRRLPRLLAFVYLALALLDRFAPRGDAVCRERDAETVQRSGTGIEVAAVGVEAHRDAAKEAEHPGAATEPLEAAEVPEAVEVTPTPVIAAVEDEAPDDSSNVLPLRKWVQTATCLDDQSVAADWPRAMLSNVRRTSTGSST